MTAEGRFAFHSGNQEDSPRSSPKTPGPFRGAEALHIRTPSPCVMVWRHTAVKNLTQATQRRGNAAGSAPNLLRALTEPRVKSSLSFRDTRDEEPSPSGTCPVGG